MVKGIVNVVIYYSVGIALTWISYLIFGEGIGHAPGVPYLIIFLMLAGGVIWTGKSVISLFKQENLMKLMGIIFTHLAIILGFSLYTYFTVIREEKMMEAGDFNQSTLETAQQGDTTTITYNGVIIYLEIKDSVYLDFRDSVTSTLK